MQKIVERELERVLTLLRNKIRERGFTQLEVQEALSWGRSYISQLLTKQKSLRVEQVLLILNVIGVEPGEFFAELYRFPADLAASDYGEPGVGMAPFNSSAVAEAGDDKFRHDFEQSRALLRGLVQVMLDKGVISNDELTAAVKSWGEENSGAKPDDSPN